MTRPTPKRGFAQVEFEQRLEKAQARMREEQVDLLFLTTEPELRYFSGFLTQFWQSPTRPWFMLIPRTGKPVAVIPEIGMPVMARTWLDDIRTWSSPDPVDDGVGLLIETIAELTPSGARIGTMLGAETYLRMPLRDFDRLRTGLEAREFVDATDILSGLRMVKSEREIEKIAHICGIASDTFSKAGDLFQEGQPLDEAFRAFKIACLGNGADDVPYLVGAAGHGGYDDVISPPSNDPICAGDVLMLDTGAVFDGYFCDFDRNFAISTASDQSRKLYDTLWLATEAGLSAARPGATCAELFQAMQKVITKGGGADGSVGRLGHGLGMQLTEWPSHTLWDQTVLREGMVLTLEPSMSLGDGVMMVHEENIVIRDGAPELLSVRAPRELPVIGG